MSLPDQEVLSRAYPNNVWDKATAIDMYIEGILERLVPVGGKIACRQYTVVRTEGGMHFEEAVGKRAHVDIDVDLNEGEGDKEIRGTVVPTVPLDQATIDDHNISLVLAGEVVCDKLWKCAEAMGDLSGIRVFMPETLLAS